MSQRLLDILQGRNRELEETVKLLKRIAHRFTGIDYEDLTELEKNIADSLCCNGFLWFSQTLNRYQTHEKETRKQSKARSRTQKEKGLIRKANGERNSRSK